MPADPYVRAVTVVRVIDGDTFVADVDLGFYVRVRLSCRLAGVNCPELTEPGGAEARTALATMLGLGPVTVASVRVDKFSGRFDADVVVSEPTRDPGFRQEWHVNGWMVERGYAVRWDGRGAKPAVAWPPPGWVPL